MLLAGIFLTLNDGITKWLVPHFPVGQILCIQALIIGAISICILKFEGKSPFAFVEYRGHILRSIMYLIGSFAFVTALRYLPLAEVVAIAFAGPIFMTLFGKIFLKENVGVHRILAVVCGFVGVLIIIRPGSSAMHWAMILPLIVAVSDAFRDIVTRSLTTIESSYRIILSTAMMLVLAGALTMPFGWEPVGVNHIAWFSFSACSFVLAHYFLIEAFRYAQVGVVAPFKYIQLIWGVIAGIVFWGEIPATLVYCGIATIIGSGIYIIWRESKQ
jgi:drug/metabolite transporter (DMT)-like permease